MSISLLSLVQGDELDLFWLKSFISERTLDCVQIVSSERNEGSSSSKIVMKLVLEVDEAVISILSKGDISENSTDADFSQIIDLKSLLSTLGLTCMVRRSLAGLEVNLAEGRVPR